LKEKKMPRKQRKRDDSQEARILYKLACRLAGVPDGSRPPTDEQMRRAILDLTARRSGMSRQALEAIPSEERARIVEAHMPRSAEELARLLADEWARRAQEALNEITQGLEEALSGAAAAYDIQAETIGGKRGSEP
jgi:hypothetical protein